MDRFFYPTLSDGMTVTLADEEFHHLVHVLRARAGERVELFDGAGGSAEAVIERLSKREAQLSLVSDVRRDVPPAISLVLAVACPKGDRLKWLVEKATELGVVELVPLQCERSVVEPRETKLARLEQTVLAACKQCRRNTLMRIGEPRSLADLIARASKPVWIAHPGGLPASRLLNDLESRQAGMPLEIHAAVGPEGGFTDAEVSHALAAGADSVSLGQHVLRVETAALALASVVLAMQSAG